MRIGSLQILEGPGSIPAGFAPYQDGCVAVWGGEGPRPQSFRVRFTVTTDAAAAVLSIEAKTARGRALGCELLLLPLRHGNSGFDRVLGSLAPLERAYWIGSEPVTGQSLTSLRLIWPDERPHFMRRASERPQAEAAVILPLDGRRRRGHLFVLDGGKG